MMQLTRLVLILSLVLAGNSVLLAEEKADTKPAEKTKEAKEEKADKGKDSKDKKKDKKDKKKTIAEQIKDKKAHTGFLNLYQDEETGSVMMTLTDDQLNKPFIYFAHTVNGVLAAGHFKGNFRDNKLLEFRKAHNKIEIISKRPNYYIDPDSALIRSQGTNESEAVLASVKIESSDKKKGEYLLKMDGTFLGEAIHKVSPYPRPRMPGAPPAPPRFKLGKLSKDKTKYVGLRSYPKNTDVTVEYVFDNPAPSVGGGAEVTDPRNVSIQLQHSFIEMPDNDFQPRRDDARLGYFTEQVTDLTSDSWAPYRDVINVWNLVKKDPTAELSEPVEPITWWIENTTPVEWRDTIKEGVLAWNQSFEKAGFKNAMVVKVQPDDAEWDAGDIRYNVLRWTSSPRPPFGGYGPSVTNPLTGEIIAADIMLEYVFMKNRWLQGDLYTQGGDMTAKFPELEESHKYCSYGHNLQADLMSARAILDAQGLDMAESERLTKEALIMLILHEVGHTLGLNHNMRASQQYNEVDIHSKEITKGSLTGSVMDYAPTNIAPPGIEQGHYADIRPGAYDDWAIEYGYSPALADAEAEEKRLQAILARSTESGLAFGNDADDMRSPGRHIDPRVMIGDMSSNAIAYSEGRAKLIKDTFGKLMERSTTEGESYQELTTMFNVLFRGYVSAINIATRYVGGVYIDRAVVGQEGATQPYTPVSEADQRRAMKLIADYMFAPNLLPEANDYFQYLQVQRRGFNNYGRNEDPKVHDMWLNAQRALLNHLMHPNVLKRMTDTSMYGNTYSLNEMMNDLTKAIFDADRKGNVSTVRQNLQVEYVKRLIGASGLKGKTRYDNFTVSAAIYQLQQIEKNYTSSRGNLSTKSHRNYIGWLIKDAFQQYD